MTSRFRHCSYVVNLLGASLGDRQHLALIMDLAEGGNLSERIHSIRKRRLGYLEVLQVGWMSGSTKRLVHPAAPPSWGEAVQEISRSSVPVDARHLSVVRLESLVREIPLGTFCIRPKTVENGEERCSTDATRSVHHSGARFLHACHILSSTAIGCISGRVTVVNTVLNSALLGRKRYKTVQKRFEKYCGANVLQNRHLSQAHRTG